MTDHPNTAQRRPDGLGIDWRQPAVWLRMVTVSLVMGLGIGAMPHAVGLVMEDQFQLVGKSLSFATATVSTVLVIAIAVAIQVQLRLKTAAPPLAFFTSATLRERCIIYLWLLCIATLAGITGRAIHQSLAAGANEIPRTASLIGPVLAIVVCSIVADGLVAWLRRASSGSQLP